MANREQKADVALQTTQTIILQPALCLMFLHVTHTGHLCALHDS